jgi:hypothetical protein
MAAPGLAFLAIVLSGYALSPSESTDSGKRVEADSYTGPTQIARCITYNINKKMPDLRVRSRAGDTSDESIFLILTRMESSPATFGVIRVDQSESGSHLTTWLPGSSLSEAPGEVARKLVAGC